MYFGKPYSLFFPTFLLLHQIGTVPFKEAGGPAPTISREQEGEERGRCPHCPTALITGQGGSNISLQQGSPGLQ